MRFPYFPVKNKDILDLLNARVGVFTRILCLECTNDFTIDIQKDVNKCPKCSSKNTIPVDNLEGFKCPSCNNGHFKYIETRIIS